MLEALYFDRPTLCAQRRFALLHRPATAMPIGLVLYVHPFAEEMNKSRRMAALQVQQLAGAGFAVLQPDLLGCGDSDGDFADATWNDWVDDVVAAVDCLRQRCSNGGGLPLWLWGLRAGGRLASEAATRIDGVSGLLLWQPVTSGATALKQFLRLKSAAGLLSGAKGGTDALHQQLLSGGDAVDIAGYRLSPALAQGLEAARLSTRGPGAGVAVEWLEVSSAEVPTLSPAASQAAARWAAGGANVRARPVKGPAFWQTVEIETAPALLAASTDAVCTVAVAA